jgi:hypothetical protein
MFINIYLVTSHLIFVNHNLFIKIIYEVNIEVLIKTAGCISVLIRQLNFDNSEKKSTNNLIYPSANILLIDKRNDYLAFAELIETIKTSSKVPFMASLLSYLFARFFEFFFLTGFFFVAFFLTIIQR